MFNFILSLFKKKRKRFVAKHYFRPHHGIWNYFRILFLFCTLCVTLSTSAATVNWEISNVQNPNNRAIYGLVGDTAFRQQVLDSLSNSTFSQLMANNPTALKGSYIANSFGYVKSANFSGVNNKSMTMFLVILDSTDPNNYSYADITGTKTITKLNPSKANLFSFDGSTGLTRVNNVPEPNVVFLLVLGSCIFLVSRP